MGARSGLGGVEALITVAGIDTNQAEAEKSRRVIEEVLGDHRASQIT